MVKDCEVCSGCGEVLWEKLGNSVFVKGKLIINPLGLQVKCPKCGKLNDVDIPRVSVEPDIVLLTKILLTGKYDAEKVVSEVASILTDQDLDAQKMKQEIMQIDKEIERLNKQKEELQQKYNKLLEKNRECVKQELEKLESTFMKAFLTVHTLIPRLSSILKEAWRYERNL